jgi:hypothetical protein
MSEDASRILEPMKANMDAAVEALAALDAEQARLEKIVDDETELQAASAARAHRANVELARLAKARPGFQAEADAEVAVYEKLAAVLGRAA